MRLDIHQQIKYKNGLFFPWAVHIHIQLNQMMNETPILPLQTHSIYPVVVEDIALHFHPSLSMYRLLTMQFVVEFSHQICFYQMIHYPVMILLIETIIQCWEQEVEIQTLMKGRPCYTNFDNSEVTLWSSVVVVPVSTQTHLPFIHRYCDFHYWWTVVAWYLTDQVKSDQVLKMLVTLALCSVKTWMTIE